MSYEYASIEGRGEVEHPRTEPLLVFAEPLKQTEAAFELVRAVESYTTAAAQKSYIDQTKGYIADSWESPEQAIRAAIACYDYCLSDEVRVYAGILPPHTDGAAVYFRSDVYKQDYPSDMLEVLGNYLGYDPNTIIIGTIEQIGHYSHFSGQRGMLTPDFMFWVNEQNATLPPPEPPCGVPRQELYRSLLRCGINPIKPQEEANEALVYEKEPEDYYKILYRRKAYVARATTPEKVQLWEAKTASHWGRLLHSTQPALLFASGTSANEIAMYAITKARQIPAYFHPYWYYENMPSAQILFKEPTEKSDVRALFVNLEPTNFFCFENEPENPRDLIEWFIKKAQRNPEEVYYLTLDATTDPLYDPCERLNSSPPTNLRLIRTTSASKHQDGGRNYFFGVSHTDDPALYNLMLAGRDELGGKPYEQQIIHFPRPTAAWLREKKELIAAKNNQLSYITQGSDGWRIVPHSYHSFIFPPDKLLGDVMRSMSGLHSTEEREAKMRPLNNHIFEIVRSVVLSAGQKHLELGDSFGFPQTRINVQGGPNIVGGVEFRLKLPRICPGFNTDTNIIISAARRIIGELDGSLPSL